MVTPSKAGWSGIPYTRAKEVLDTKMVFKVLTSIKPIHKKTSAWLCQWIDHSIQNSRFSYKYNGLVVISEDNLI